MCVAGNSKTANSDYIIFRTKETSPPHNMDNPEQSDISKDRQSTSLVVVNNRVVLPKTRAVVLESRKFHALLKRTVPTVAPELIEALKARQDRPSRIQRLGLFVGLVAVFASVFCLWPRSMPLQDTTLTYEIASLTSDTVGNEYKRLQRECKVLMNQGEYTECVKRLRDPVAAIMEDPALFRDNARLLSMYLECNKMTSGPSRSEPLRMEMLRHCRKAQEYSDSPEWKVYGVYFQWARLKPSCDAFRRGNLAGLKKKEDRQRLERSLAALDAEANRTYAILMQRPDAKEFQVTLEKLRCEILIARWLVEGYPHYPDDFGNAGVAFREEAYRIAKKYDNDVAFLEMRLEIATRILNGDHWYSLNNYYFDGKKYLSASHLENAIAEINMEIRRRGPGQGTQGGGR